MFLLSPFFSTTSSAQPALGVKGEHGSCSTQAGPCSTDSTASIASSAPSPAPSVSGSLDEGHAVPSASKRVSGTALARAPTSGIGIFADNTVDQAAEVLAENRPRLCPCREQDSGGLCRRSDSSDSLDSPDSPEWQEDGADVELSNTHGWSVLACGSDDALPAEGEALASDTWSAAAWERVRRWLGESMDGLSDVGTSAVLYSDRDGACEGEDLNDLVSRSEDTASIRQRSSLSTARCEQRTGVAKRACPSNTWNSLQSAVFSKAKGTEEVGEILKDDALRPAFKQVGDVAADAQNVVLTAAKRIVTCDLPAAYIRQSCTSAFKVGGGLSTNLAIFCCGVANAPELSRFLL